MVVTKLDRLARSLPDARDILDELTRRNVKLSLGGSIHDPTDPLGRLLFNVLAMVAEFESDLIKMRTRQGIKVAKAKGRLRGKQPKLKPNQAKHLLALYDSGNYTQAELAELFGVGRSTIYRTIERMRPQFVEPERPFGHLVPPSPNTQISTPRKSCDGESIWPVRRIQSRSPNLQSGFFLIAPVSKGRMIHAMPRCPWQGLNSAMDRKRNAQRQ